MVDAAFVIRTGPSGPDMPQSTPGNVLTVQADGVSVAAEPVPTPPSGGITPLALVLNVDSSGTPIVADGAFSGDKAYAGSSAVQDAQAAAVLAGSAVVLISNCTEEAVTFGNGGAVRLLIRSYQEQRVDGQNLSTTPFPKLGACSIDMGAAPAGGPLIDLAGLTFASFAFNGAGGYTSTMTQCFVSGNLTGSGGQQPALYGTCVAGDATVGQLDLYESQVIGILTLTAPGTSKWRNATVGACTVDAVDAFNCRIAGLLGGGTTPGACKFRQCNIVAGVTSSCSLDAETELVSMKGGAAFGDTVFALSAGQGGDASPITGSQAFDFSGPTRAFICATVLAGNIVVTLNETAGADGDQFWIDVYNTTAHTVTIKDSAATTLKVCPTEAAGAGTRYFFERDAATHIVVYKNSKKL
jgi:hypothetical protein